MSTWYNFPEPHLNLSLTGPRSSGLRQIQLAVPGAYEKPQPLQPTTEPGLPSTFTFHVNPVMSPMLYIELKEKLQVLHVSELWQGRNDGVSPCRRGLRSVWEAHLPSHPQLLGSLLHRLAQVMIWRLRQARQTRQASCSPLYPLTRS